MKRKVKTLSKRTRAKRKTPAEPSSLNQSSGSLPRCSRCGARTVHLEQLQQELLATLSLHCLICGHHTFLGKPVIRLIRRPDVPSPLRLQKAREAS